MSEIEEWLPMVRGVAVEMKRRYPRSVEFADLYQMGCMGLLSAIRHFDPARNVKFKTYARQWVWGSMAEGIRCQSWVPKEAYAKGAKPPTVTPISGDGGLVDRAAAVSHRVEVMEQVGIVLNRLDKPERDLVVGRYIREEPVETIARRNGITSRNVRIRLARILVQLRESPVRRVASFRSYRKRSQPTLEASTD